MHHGYLRYLAPTLPTTILFSWPSAVANCCTMAKHIWPKTIAFHKTMPSKLVKKRNDSVQNGRRTTTTKNRKLTLSTYLYIYTNGKTVGRMAKTSTVRHSRETRNDTECLANIIKLMWLIVFCVCLFYFCYSCIVGWLCAPAHCDFIGHLPICAQCFHLNLCCCRLFMYFFNSHTHTYTDARTHSTKSTYLCTCIEFGIFIEVVTFYFN